MCSFTTLCSWQLYPRTARKTCLERHCSHAKMHSLSCQNQKIIWQDDSFASKHASLAGVSPSIGVQPILGRYAATSDGGDDDR